MINDAPGNPGGPKSTRRPWEPLPSCRVGGKANVGECVLFGSATHRTIGISVLATDIT